jgi:molybdate transport system ATP-binding protein
MSERLVADFEKRFPGGVRIAFGWDQPPGSSSVTVLFGPSGCGKTTALRCLAGLARPDAGVIRRGDEVWFDAERRIHLSPQRRGVGLLFQDYALFPHLTVAGNVGFALASLPRAERKQRVESLLTAFELTELARRYPSQVSGGQQQRVALARAFARRPRLLLLDEPLSALDGPTRDQLRPELRRQLARFGVPVVLVTHDRGEAMALADHLVVMDQGRIVQQGPVADVFSRPAGLAVARIVGTETVHPGEVVGVADGLATVQVGEARVVGVAPDAPVRDVFVCVRGEDVVLQRGAGGESSPRNRLNAVVGSLTWEGPLVRVGLDCGFPLVALVTRPACTDLVLSVGDHVTALLKAPAVHLIPRPPAEPACGPQQPKAPATALDRIGIVEREK